MKARAAELRAEGKKGAKKADGLQAVLDSIFQHRGLTRPAAKPSKYCIYLIFMSAEMKLSTRASGVLQLFIHDTVARSSSCL